MRNKLVWCSVTLLVLAVLSLGAWYYLKSVKSTDNNVVNEKKDETSKKDQEGSAGSNMPLKDNLKEAEYQIKVAMQKWIDNAYGSEVVDARINVDKVYTKEDENKNPALKDEKLGANEVAFEVSYELKLADGVTDTIKYTIANGIYDENSGWVKDKSNVGILRPDGDSYKITDFGTGW